MSRFVWGIVKDGVIVPDSPLAEGQRAEIAVSEDWRDLIHNRGRGPEIKGTRITVYDVVDYLLDAWPPYAIAALFRVETRQVEAAIGYIREHTLEVMREYTKILDRSAQGNPPELQARLDAGRARFHELTQKIRSLPDADPKVRKQKTADLVAEYRKSRSHGEDNGQHHAGQ